MSYKEGVTVIDFNLDVASIGHLAQSLVRLGFLASGLDMGCEMGVTGLYPVD